MAGRARFSVSVDERLLKQFDSLTRREGFPTRSEAITDCMHQRLVAREWAAGEEVAGAVALVYDHHRAALVGRLMSIQHDFGNIVVSTQHIHLDHDNCLELVVVRGKARDIRNLVSRLKSVKGFKHHALMATTTGKGFG
jgi:CopG family nickel-responsive transcriptional regulator